MYNFKSYWFNLLSTVVYNNIMILGDSFLLGTSKPGYENLDIFCADAKFSEYRYDVDLIFYDRRGCLVGILMRHVELFCLELSGVWIKDLGLSLRSLYLLLCGV